MDVDRAFEIAEGLEQVVLRLIDHGKDRCGAGFGKYPLGVRAAVEELLPLVRESAAVKVALAEFDARLSR